VIGTVVDFTILFPESFEQAGQRESLVAGPIEIDEIAPAAALGDSNDLGQSYIQRSGNHNTTIAQESPKHRIGVVQETHIDFVQLTMKRPVLLHPEAKKLEAHFEIGLKGRGVKAIGGKKVEVIRLPVAIAEGQRSPSSEIEFSCKGKLSESC
jgi:hypothetical protein